MKLGPYAVDVPVMLAPMAGMSDLPYREICRAHGAGYAVGEMTTCQPQFRTSRKSATRWACDAELGLRVVQLLGADPAMMADAARYAEDSGAQVVDPTEREFVTIPKINSSSIVSPSCITLIL